MGFLAQVLGSSGYQGVGRSSLERLASGPQPLGLPDWADCLPVRSGPVLAGCFMPQLPHAHAQNRSETGLTDSDLAGDFATPIMMQVPVPAQFLRGALLAQASTFQ